MPPPCFRALVDAILEDTHDQEGILGNLPEFSKADIRRYAEAVQNGVSTVMRLEGIHTKIGSF